MKTLFGMPMDSIMIALLSVFLLVTTVVAMLALRNRLLFKLALRNIPRRRAQTLLIVVGLMLSTVIITSAFGTGDTISYSVRAAAVAGLGNVDEAVFHTGGIGSKALVHGVGPISARTAAAIEANVAANPKADGSMTALIAEAPLQDLTSGQTKAGSLLEAFPATYSSAFGGLTTTGGSAVMLSTLAANEAYLNQKAADSLNAHSGDQVTVVFAGQRLKYTVRAILRNENLATGGLSTSIVMLKAGVQFLPSIILPLGNVHNAQPNVVLVSNRGDATSGADNTTAVTTPLRALLANPRDVAIAKSLLASPVGIAALHTLIGDGAQAEAKTHLTSLLALVTQPGQSPDLRNLLSDPTVISALKTISDPKIAGALNNTLASISDYSVQTAKQDGLQRADLFGSIFMSVFIVFGLFSIAAGIMLIFLIFVMLAAERRAEMGMARAVGTKRRQLIQQFLFEGYVYNLGAALVGLVLGVGVGFGMVKIMGILLHSVGFTTQGHVEPRSLVVAFCLGALVTFLTVVVSSFRVSRLNIVAAIRDLPEDFGTKKTVRESLVRSLKRLPRHPRRMLVRTILTVAAVVIGLLTFPVGNGAITIPLFLVMAGIYFWPLVAAFIARGPILLAVGVALFSLGLSTKQAAWFGLGTSLLVIGASMLLRWMLSVTPMRTAVANRIGYSLAGATLVVYWLLPLDFLEQFGLPKLSSGIEMFFVSGLLLVIGGVWTVMFNADLLANGLMRVFGAAGHLGPVLKMAVTYPMQFKFRTGLTLAMFSLVIFTLMVMSVLTDSTSGNLNLDRDTGGYQLFGSVSQPGSTADSAAIAANPALRKAIIAHGGIGQIGIGVRQPGQSDQSWQAYNANVLDNDYLNSTRFALHSHATGYASGASVWRTIKNTPGFAVVDSALIADAGGFPGSFSVAGISYNDKVFTPRKIEVRDIRTGKIVSLTVIGVLSQSAANLDALTTGIYTGQNSFTNAGIPPVAPTTYVYRTAPGANVHATALLLGKTFLKEGLDVKEVQKEFDTNQAVGIGLNQLLQGFMGLGLIVGIAALGVIAFRSVVERRQQIGMMRAIGFKRRMVRTAFLLESSFVAIVGTLLGVILGLVLAKDIVDSMAKNDSSITLSIPWLQILLIVGIAYVASLITTYVPAWQASRVAPADALRYE